MYIGPWQEYKLARLLQQQQTALAQEIASQRPVLPRQHAVDRSISRLDLKVEDLETASVTSSTRSTTSYISTRSAPSRCGGTSAQARLDRLYQDAEKSGHRSSTPRTRSGSSGRTSRPASSGGSSSRPSGRPPLAGAKRSAASKKAAAKQSEQSLIAQRRARIAQMQRLYGLGGDDDSSSSSSMLPLTAEAPLENRSSPASPAPSPAVSAQPAAVAPREELVQPENLASSGAILRQAALQPQHQQQRSLVAPPYVDHSSPAGVALEPVIETKEDLDPLALSLSGDADMNLIAWSQNLRPEDVASEGTLESFFPAV